MRYLLERMLIAVLSLWMGLATIHAANTVTVEGAQGSPGQQVAIKVLMTTGAADVTAAEIRVPLPEEVLPIDGSLTLNGTRVPEHSVTADMNGREYVIVLFNTSLKTIPAGEGELLTFNVDLGDNPGHFDLTPRVKLSGTNGTALSTNVSGGILSVLAPRMELNTLAVDFGRVPIQSEVLRDVEIRNIGTTALTVSDYTTGVEGLTAVFPGTIEAGKSGYAKLHYCPTVRCKGIDDRITPISNGVGRSQFIRIQSVPFSVNELHIGDAVGICDGEVNISVTMNNMEPIVGAEFTIQLPDELDFIEGSVAKGPRASGLSVESYVSSDRKLRLVLFGTDNKAVEGNDGELLNFRLKLKGRSGGYSINPDKAILVNADGENMVSAVYSGEVRISSPRLSAPSDWSIGNVSMSGIDTFMYSLRSEGEAPLTVEKVVFLNDLVECTDQFPMVIEPNGERNISVKFRHMEFGPFATTMNIYTNDPDNRMKSVDVTGNFYSPNEMSFIGRNDNEDFFIDAYLANEEAIAALQLDVVCLDGVSTDESLLKLSSRAENHSATLAKVEDNRYRIIIFSLKNTPFIGNEGIVFSLGMNGESLAGKQIRIENIKLSSVDGVNITTPDSEVKDVTDVEAIPTDLNDEIEVYNMSGLKVAESTEGLAKGIYIIRQGKTAVKIVVR